MPQALTAVLVGAGNRGADVYGPYALDHPDHIRFVAVAEPLDLRRDRFAAAHAIPSDSRFRTWQELLARQQIADVALICTQDHLHVEPAIAALEAGYDVLLEKPIAPNLADCVRLVQVAERTGRTLQLCHVLRYTPFFSTIRNIVSSGRLGDVITVEHRENVAYWHMAHSYVRGHWRNSRHASPMILAKCCHDLDLLHWYLGRCEQLSSTGSLIHFRPENAPTGAPDRCTDGCPSETECPWYAPRLYLDIVPLLHMGRNSTSFKERLLANLVLAHPKLFHVARRLAPVLDYRGWPLSVISEDTSVAARRRALETGPYGRCVYRCDNDVVDHQLVSMQFESGASAVLVMHGHSHREGRTLRIDGTRATLRGQFYSYRQEIEIHDHLTGKAETLRFALGTDEATGHAGGDAGLMSAFVRAVRGRTHARGAQPMPAAREFLESHLMAFAAEDARVRRCVVHMDEFRRWAETREAP